VTQAAASFTARRERYRQDFELTADGVFTVMVRPIGTPRSGVLICPSLGEDNARNSRREVLLARRLAALGVAVQRFSYRGTGYREGEHDELTWSRIVEDATKAWSNLTRQIGGDLPCGIMSSRFGSLVAAAVGVGQRLPMALWEPITEGKTYLRELARMERVAVITGRHDEEVAIAAPLPRRLSDELSDLSLEDLAGEGLGPVLIVRLGRAASPTSASDDERIAAVATSVEHRDHPEEGTWWAGARRDPRGVRDPWPLLDVTAQWLSRALETEDR